MSAFSGVIPYQGIKNSLGFPDAGSHTVVYQLRQGANLVTTQTVNFSTDRNDNLVSIDGTPVANYGSTCAATTGSNTSVQCALINGYKAGSAKLWTSINGITFDPVSQTQSTESSGVFEYQDMVTALGGVSILLVIIFAGITIAKRTVRATTEETSDDDELEWYTGEDGKEYWRIKRYRLPETWGL